MGQKPCKNIKDAPVILIVGAGPGGRECAKALDPHCNVVLIDRTSYYLHNIAALRASVQPGFEEKILIPYDRLMENGHFIVGEVSNITEKEVFLTGEIDALPFDYLIIATGSAYAFPFKVQRGNQEELLKTYRSLQDDIHDASEVLIIGGGPVGIELAGEILEFHQGKSVTLVHSQKMLLSQSEPEKLRAKLQRELTTLGCKFQLGDRAKTEDIKELLQGPVNYLKGKRTIETDSGKKIDADLVFLATGARVNSASYAESMKSSISRRNELIVNDHGQVLKEGNVYYENIFALGDCSSWGAKMAYCAMKQAAVVAKNIRSHMKEAPMTASWTNPPPMKGAMLVPVGTSYGAGYISGHVVGRRVTGMVKGKDLFVSSEWKAHGYKTVGEKGGPIRGDPRTMAEVLNISAEQGQRLAEGLEVKEDDIKIVS